MKKIYLYGSGNRCRILCSLIERTEYFICGIVDSDNEKWGTYIKGIQIESPDVLLHEEGIYVCVTFYSSLVYEPVWDELKNTYSIDEQHLLSFYDVVLEISRNSFSINKRICTGRKRKVFFDGTWGLGLGGVESWLIDIMQCFKRYGLESIYLLTSMNKFELPVDILSNVIDLYIRDSGEYMCEDIKRCIDFIFEQLPCTMVFSRVDELMLAACLIKEIYPDMIKIIMTDHGSCDGMYRDILSFKEAIDQYVCVSYGIKEQLEIRGVLSTAIHTMTIPIEFGNYTRTYTMDKQNPLQIGYAGRLVIFEKRMDVLLKLIDVLEKENVNYMFNIVGDGDFRSEIDCFIKTHMLENKVKLWGRIDRKEVAEFWRKQDIAINVSDNEGRPISNLEAMLNGAVPVVTATIGVMEDVKDGINGYVVPICDYKSMADKIKYIDKNRNILPDMGRKAYNDIRDKVNKNEYVKMWSELVYS